MIGTTVVFANVNGLERRGSVIAQDEASGLIQVEWQPWPTYLATLLLQAITTGRTARRITPGHTHQAIVGIMGRLSWLSRGG